MILSPEVALLLAVIGRAGGCCDPAVCLATRRALHAARVGFEAMRSALAPS